MASAAANRSIFSLFFAVTLVLTLVGANSDGSVPSISDSEMRIELDQLKSNIVALESSIDKMTSDIKSKDESIKQQEMIILEKSTSLASLQSEIQSLQEKGSLVAKEQVGEAHSRAGELESQVDILKREIEKQKMRKDMLEARANVAEAKIKELNSKLDNLQKINDEQKTRIRRTERALQVAEDEMRKAQLEATHTAKKLTQVHGAWLPPWLELHLVQFQSFVVTKWNEHGRPAMDVAIEKALQSKARFEKWSEPHIETFKTKWIPAAKEQWFTFVSSVEPNVQLLAAKTIEMYHVSKDTVRPHISNVQKVVDPYFQEAKKASTPYINQVSTMARPHVDKARTFLKPYSKKVIRGYRKSIKAVLKYHQQVHAAIKEKLKNNELTSSFATDDIVWYMASAVLALPVIFLFKLVSEPFWKKTKQPPRSSHKSHTRRRAKRVHSDN